MDFAKLLGGIALGATGAALFDAMMKKNPIMGQGVITGGVGGGLTSGFGGGGPGVFAGPPSSGGGAGMGPGVISMMPSDGGDGESGQIVSVLPEIVGPGLPGGSFYGVNTSPWFWPLNVNWLFPRPPAEMICVKAETEQDEEILVCRETYPVRPIGQAYAWGPSAGWL
jgi:hypothetical protein